MSRSDIDRSPRLWSTEIPCRKSNTRCKLLKVDGIDIVEAASGKIVVLKGVGLGGHLNMENFITGYPGQEHEHRAAMAQVLGPQKAKHFFDRFLYHFFTDADAAFLASLGLNCIRVPFNYRHFIDDQNPDHEYKEDRFEWLDRIVDICGRHNLYVILDLHAAPGGQNQDWHSDSGSSKALFWEYRVFQDQTVNLWIERAKHYSGNPIIAGFNPLNEPADREHIRLISFYDRIEKAIRKVDPDTILFLEGNTYAMDFSHFPDTPLPNTVYACHDYAIMGFPVPGQPEYSGTAEERNTLHSQFDQKAAYTKEKNVPLWNGEFGPVYASATDPDHEATNAARLNMLREQLSIYKDNKTSWSIWPYKDIGLQGMVYVHPSTPYMKLIAPFLEKKHLLGLDFWGNFDKSGVSYVYDPLLANLKSWVPEHHQESKYPNIWSFERHFERVVREGLLSEYLNWEFAELFEGKTEEELEELASSFRFENCIRRDGLNQILQDDAVAAAA